MTTPLSRNATADIMGVDLTHVGLLCRFVGCRKRFIVRGWETTGAAAKLRDEHEVEIHGYHHVTASSESWNFSQKFSRRGRSTLGKG